MSKGYSGHFNGTLGTTYGNSKLKEKSYSDRGIEIPKELKTTLSKLKKKGDYIAINGKRFSMKDVSIMSKETGVEFAKVKVDGKSYIIRGDRNGTTIPKILLDKMKSGSGKLAFHSHPHNGDLVPSSADKAVMKTLRKTTGQRVSTIVTPDGRTCTFNEHGVVSTGTVSNKIDKSLREAYIKMFGGK